MTQAERRAARLAAGRRCADCNATLAFHELGSNTHCTDCIERHREERDARNKQIIALRASGMTMSRIAATVGAAESTVRLAIRAHEREEAEESESLNAGERCPVCSLLLPHYVCLAPSWAVAAQRRGEAASG